MHVKNIEVIYFDSFGAEQGPKKNEKIIRHKNIKTNIFRKQANNSIMFGHFWIGFIHFMFAGKNLIDYTGLFFPYDFEKNYNMILSYFKNE